VENNAVRLLQEYKTNKHSFPTLGFTDIGQSHVAWHVLSIIVLGGWANVFNVVLDIAV